MSFSQEEEIRVQRVEIELEKLNMKQEFTKAWVEEQVKSFVVAQDTNKKEVHELKTMMQGSRQSPGLLEEIRNLKKQIKIYGILLSCLFAGGQFDIFSILIKSFTK